MRTKPIMCKRMLRSVLAVAFSAGLVFGMVSTLDLGWDSTKSVNQAKSAQDLGWDIVRAGVPA
ncbi:hypothetical protein AB0L59_14180 [Streptomyces sp. NPDC052109]|uniref:hypothetical protein n=1 Tax=Streptomyces sp. NPDC052109 TaxID=3155527 RepID=UPI00342B9AB3